MDDRFTFPNRHAANLLLDARVGHLQTIDLDTLYFKLVGIAYCSLQSPVAQDSEAYLFGCFKFVVAARIENIPACSGLLRHDAKNEKHRGEDR
jgi:hypothetical protein